MKKLLIMTCAAVTLAATYLAKADYQYIVSGYPVANRGQLISWPSSHNPKRECPIDNIMVKGFEMSDVQVRGHNKLSDHKMISCRLKFKE